MDMIILMLAVLLWIFTWKFGWRIMKWKNRKMALVMTVLFPYIGLLFALFLDQKCPHCGKCINMAADTCPYCAKDIKTGKSRVRVGNAGEAEKKPVPESEKKVGDAVCITEAMSDERRAEEIRTLKEQVKSMEKKEGIAEGLLGVGCLIVGGVALYMFISGGWGWRRSWKMFFYIMLVIAGLCKIVVFDKGGLWNNGEFSGKDADKLRMLKKKLNELKKIDGE